MIEGSQMPVRFGRYNSRWDSVERLLGTTDLHYHFRTKPLFKFFSQKEHGGDVRVIEFGCGDGSNLFELKSRLPSMTAVGVDIDSSSINAARKCATVMGYENFNFVCAHTLNATEKDVASFDFVLLMDVLEHLTDARALMDEVSTLLKPNGTILISVPTHRYPRVFGREFHRKVGHVRDGFNMDELDELLGTSYKRTASRYRTGLLASAACACFYRLTPKIPFRKLQILLIAGLHFSRLIDIFNGKSLSCSIWAVYKRQT